MTTTTLERSKLADFAITKRWPAKNPDIIQLYSLATPNGVKVSIALEELGLEYEPHKISFGSEGVESEEFLSLNPNNKIPALIDPNGPDGKAIGLFESGAILIYLAEKTGKLIGKNAIERMEVIKWLMFQMGGVGPMFGQLGFFHKYAGSEIEDPRPVQRYINEVKRLLNVVDQQVANQDWIAGDFSIADIAIVPWLQTIEKFYGAEEVTELHKFKNVKAYIDRFAKRPAVEKGWGIPASE